MGNSVSYMRPGNPNNQSARIRVCLFYFLTALVLFFLARVCLQAFSPQTSNPDQFQKLLTSWGGLSSAAVLALLLSIPVFHAFLIKPAPAARNAGMDPAECVGILAMLLGMTLSFFGIYSGFSGLLHSSEGYPGLETSSQAIAVSFVPACLGAGAFVLGAASARLGPRPRASEGAAISADSNVIFLLFLSVIVIGFLWFVQTASYITTYGSGTISFRSGQFIWLDPSKAAKAVDDKWLLFSFAAVGAGIIFAIQAFFAERRKRLAPSAFGAAQSSHPLQWVVLIIAISLLASVAIFAASVIPPWRRNECLSIDSMTLVWTSISQVLAFGYLSALIAFIGGEAGWVAAAFASIGGNPAAVRLPPRSLDEPLQIATAAIVLALVLANLGSLDLNRIQGAYTSISLPRVTEGWLDGRSSEHSLFLAICKDGTIHESKDGRFYPARDVSESISRLDSTAPTDVWITLLFAADSDVEFSAIQDLLDIIPPKRKCKYSMNVWSARPDDWAVIWEYRDPKLLALDNELIPIRIRVSAKDGKTAYDLWERRADQVPSDEPDRILEDERDSNRLFDELRKSMLRAPSKDRVAVIQVGQHVTVGSVVGIMDFLIGQCGCVGLVTTR